MMRKKYNQGISLVVLVVLLLSYFTGVFNWVSLKSYAQSEKREEQLLDTEVLNAKVAYSYEQEAHQIRWTLSLEKFASQEHPRRVLVAINTPESGDLGQPEIRQLPPNFVEPADLTKDWIQQTEVSTTYENNQVTFVTPIKDGHSEKKVQFQFQVIEERMKTTADATGESLLTSDSVELLTDGNRQQKEVLVDEALIPTVSNESATETTTETGTTTSEIVPDEVASEETGMAAEELDNQVVTPAMPAYFLLDLFDESSIPKPRQLSSTDPFAYEQSDTQQPDNLEKRYVTPGTPWYATSEVNGKTTAYESAKISNISSYPATAAPSDSENYLNNYDYTTNQPTSSGIAETVNLWGTSKDFSTSYLDYGNAYLKKWAAPVPNTNNNGYDIYLDVVGKDLKAAGKLDLVLVLDKSGSMSGAKHTALINSVNTIVDDLLGSSSDKLSAKIGLATYAGTSSNHTQVLSLTDSISTIKNSGALRQSSTGGTFTSRGLAAGLEVLHDNTNNHGREDATKVLIVLSDGQPTYSYAAANGTTYGVNGNPNPTIYPKEGPLFNYDYQEFMEGTRYPHQFSGTATGSGNTTTPQMVTNTLAHALALFRPASDGVTAGPYADKPTAIYSIGYGVASNIAENNRARNVLQNISGGKTGKYFNAGNEAELTKAFRDIVETVTKTVRNARLYDATGRDVSWVGNAGERSITYYKIDQVNGPQPWTENTPEVVAHPTHNAADNNQEYTFTGITLGANEMVRIKYRVQLNGSARDGYFHLTNGETYLTNTSDGTNLEAGRMYFPSPAIRNLSEGRTLQIKKVDENGAPLQDIPFRLSKTLDPDGAVTGGYRAVTDSQGKATFPDGSIEVQQNPADLGSNYEKYNRVSDIYYLQEVVDDSEYPFPTKIQPYTKVLQFRIGYVVGSNGEEPYYEMVAVDTSKAGEAPHEEAPDFTFEANGEALQVELTMENKNKPKYLTLQKYVDLNNDQKYTEQVDQWLNGAEFSLKKVNATGATEEVARGISGENQFEPNNPRAGLLTFYSLVEKDGQLVMDQNVRYPLTEGTYHLYETGLPAGYEGKYSGTDNYWILTVPKTGNASVIHKLEPETSRVWLSSLISPTYPELQFLTFEVPNYFKQIELVGKKKSSEGTPLNGVTFELKPLPSNTAVTGTYRGITGDPHKDANDTSQKNGEANFYRYRGADDNPDELIIDTNEPLRLLPGDYSFYEVAEALINGYQYDGKTYYFRVKEAGQIVALGADGTGGFNELPTPNWLQYSENSQPGASSTLAITHINLVKQLDLVVDKIDNETKQPLAGATFEVTKVDNQGQVIEGTDAYHQRLPENTTEITTFSFKNLTLGNYRIEETANPTAYQKLPGWFILAITPNTEQSRYGEWQLTLTYYKDDQDQTGQVIPMSLGNGKGGYEVKWHHTEEGNIQLAFNVGNDPEHPLPETGGVGKWLFYSVGSLGMLGAAYIYFTSRRGRGVGNGGQKNDSH